MTKGRTKQAPLDLALEAALTLAAEKPWRDVSLQEIADEANLNLSDLYGVTDKSKLVVELEPWADKAMSAEKADMTEAPRERLFDSIMRRFEYLEVHRAGVLSMLKGRSPQNMANLLKARRQTAAWAITAAALDTGDPMKVAAQTLGLIRVITQTENAWRTDDAGDYARTMAVLDAGLIELEERWGQFSKFRSRFRSKGATSSPPEAPQAETSKA
ncbi:MAG: hypothetical protein AAF583_02570 [Pseudomonadota bacterium]